jgi:hypothetical protein
MNRREMFASLTGGALAPPSDPPAKGDWLYNYSASEIWQAVDAAGFRKDFERELRRIARHASARKRREARTENTVIWKGRITEELPDNLRFRAVRRGTRSQSATPDVRIVSLPESITWMGHDLPAGSRVLIDHAAPDAAGSLIGCTAEVMDTPLKRRVHIWRSTGPARATRSERLAQGMPHSPIMPPLSAPRPPWFDLRWASQVSI